jgi:AcrR family transcriptional regulator
MRKGERTRRAIVERSAPVFNTKGYFGTSMSELVLETGLEKGSIYNHFGSKEQLAFAAFDFSAELVLGRLEEALNGEGRVLERLLCAVEVHRTLAEDRPIQGGCPILNTAIEADDAQPALREKVRQAMDRWQSKRIGRLLLTRLVEEAGRRKIEVFTGTVLGENRSALRFFSSVLSKARFKIRNGVYHLYVPLPDPEPMCNLLKPSGAQEEKPGGPQKMRIESWKR